jgi:hypothetical protein
MLGGMKIQMHLAAAGGYRRRALHR